MSSEKDVNAFMCSVCHTQSIKTDGYYHSFRRDNAMRICVYCYENGVVWAAQQAYKGEKK